MGFFRLGSRDILSNTEWLFFLVTVYRDYTKSYPSHCTDRRICTVFEVKEIEKGRAFSG